MVSRGQPRDSGDSGGHGQVCGPPFGPGGQQPREQTQVPSWVITWLWFPWSRSPCARAACAHRDRANPALVSSSPAPGCISRYRPGIASFLPALKGKGKLEPSSPGGRMVRTGQWTPRLWARFFLWFALVCSLPKGSESGSCSFLIDSFFFNVRNESHVHARGLQLLLGWPGLCVTATRPEPAWQLVLGPWPGTLERCWGTFHPPPQSKCGRTSVYGKPLVELCLSHLPVSCRWQLLGAATAISPWCPQSHPRLKLRQPLAWPVPTAPVLGTTVPCGGRHRMAKRTALALG